MNFKNYLTEQSLDEALITFGNKRPKFGQVILLAGGAGSGKGFVTDTLIGVQAKIMDVDQVKSQIIHPGTLKLNKKIRAKYGIDVTKLNLKNPADVALLHKINDELGISQKVQDQFLRSQRNTEHLPNIIFDTTMKSENKLKYLVSSVEAAGYKNENIHIVWVINDVDKAVKQNLSRERVVPEDILIQTHQLVSGTMSGLLKGDISKYIGGDVWVVFNKQFADSTLEFANKHFADTATTTWAKAKGWTQKQLGVIKSKSNSSGSYVKDVVMFKVKDKNKKQIPFSEIGSLYLKRIKSYVPKDTIKMWEALEQNLQESLKINF